MRSEGVTAEIEGTIIDVYIRRIYNSHRHSPSFLVSHASPYLRTANNINMKVGGWRMRLRRSCLLKVA